MKPTTNAPNTVNGMAIMNSTLALKARPRELLNTFVQPGQACAAIALKNAVAQNTNDIARFFLRMDL
ncbi:hypothetical protein HUU05_25355 [candidate division KSB1 bacterium]|nr:hypothetical protein [candidate division KSB1 bacterium]